jgi:hypothetical protein
MGGGAAALQAIGDGTTGSNYGGGGSGAVGANIGAHTGGTGGPGIVVITEYDH